MYTYILYNKYEVHKIKIFCRRSLCLSDSQEQIVKVTQEGSWRLLFGEFRRRICQIQSNHPSHFYNNNASEIVHYFAHKIGSLIRMYGTRTTKSTNELFSKGGCHRHGINIGEWNGICIFREIVLE